MLRDFKPGVILKKSTIESESGAQNEVWTYFDDIQINIIKSNLGGTTFSRSDGVSKKIEGFTGLSYYNLIEKGLFCILADGQKYILKDFVPCRNLNQFLLEKVNSI